MKHQDKKLNVLLALDMTFNRPLTIVPRVVNLLRRGMTIPWSPRPRRDLAKAETGSGEAQETHEAKGGSSVWISST